jgi:hypothetical protein
LFCKRFRNLKEKEKEKKKKNNNKVKIKEKKAKSYDLIQLLKEFFEN